jgi:hypothetical protein
LIPLRHLIPLLQDILLQYILLQNQAQIEIGYAAGRPSDREQYMRQSRTGQSLALTQA